MLERVLECGTKIYERSSREWRGESVSPESGQHRSELRPANAEGLVFMLTQRKNGIYHQVYNCWQTHFLFVGFKCHERKQQSLISCRNVHKCYTNRQEEMRQEGLRSFHWSLRLSDRSLNGNCNSMSALITCFIFHAISTVWHVSCCTRLGSDPTCQQRERSDVTCWPDKIPILTCPRWRWTVEKIYHRLRHEVRLLPFTARS